MRIDSSSQSTLTLLCPCCCLRMATTSSFGMPDSVAQFSRSVVFRLESCGSLGGTVRKAPPGAISQTAQSQCKIVKQLRMVARRYGLSQQQTRLTCKTCQICGLTRSADMTNAQ